MFQDQLVNKIARFLTEVGIEVVSSPLEQDSFLPGIHILNGKLFVDETKLIYPGDLLHEAGHLAVAPGNVRHSLSGEVIIPGADMEAVEVQATAWAYAATIHLGLDARVLFHKGGYRGRSEGLIFTYGVGVYPGASALEELGMTAGPEMAGRMGVAVYPRMLRWLRE